MEHLERVAGLERADGRAAAAVDVASCLVERAGPMGVMKLHRLLYCAQAWFLAEHGRPLFDDPIEAWAAGPVVRGVHEALGGRLRVSSPAELHGDAARLRFDERRALDAVIHQYGDCSERSLATIVRAERPFREARHHGERGGADRVIPRASLVARYGSVARA